MAGAPCHATPRPLVGTINMHRGYSGSRELHKKVGENSDERPGAPRRVPLRRSHKPEALRTL